MIKHYSNLTYTYVFILLLLPSCKSCQDFKVDRENGYSEGYSSNIEVNDSIALEETKEEKIDKGDENYVKFHLIKEQSTLLGRKTFWILGRPDAMYGYHVHGINNEILFTADSGSLIVKENESWYIHKRFTDFDLGPIWVNNPNDIYIGIQNEDFPKKPRIFHIDENGVTTFKEWNPPGGFKKIPYEIRGCPNGDMIVISRLLKIAEKADITYAIDFYKNGSWESLPVDNAIPLGLLCDKDDTKIYMNYYGDDTAPKWLKREDIILLSFKWLSIVTHAWSDGKGFLAFTVPHKEKRELCFYKNGSWKKEMEFADPEDLGLGHVWGLRDDFLFVSGSHNHIWHYDGKRWQKEEIVCENISKLIRGSISIKHVFGNNEDEIYGSESSGRIIFKRGNDKKWRPIGTDLGEGVNYPELWVKTFNTVDGGCSFISNVSIYNYQLNKLSNELIEVDKVIKWNEEIKDVFITPSGKKYVLLSIYPPAYEIRIIGDSSEVEEKIDIPCSKPLGEPPSNIKVFNDEKEQIAVTADQGRILVYDGSEWSEERICPKSALVTGIYGRKYNNFFVVGEKGCFVKKESDKWIKIKTGTQKGIWSINGISDDEFMIGGEDGLLIAYKDGKLNRIDTQINGDIMDILINNNDMKDYYLLSDEGEIEACLGGNCERLKLTNASLKGRCNVKNWGTIIVSGNGAIIGIKEH